MKYCFKKIAKAVACCVILFGVTGISYAAETVCNDNGGAGWPIADGSITNVSIPFNFGDVSTIHDVNISTDISHTYIGDLTVKVTSPDLGTVVRMFERPGTTTTFDSAPTSTGPPWGCNQNNIAVTFDDEAASGVNIENLCPPVTNGTYLTDDPALDLSAFDGEDPSGNWNFYLSDSANGDTGTLNQACITAAFAAVAFDKWVSTNNTCSDTLDALTVTSGTDVVYYCYTASNPSTETFTINPGDAVDDQGHDISALETTYVQGASQTVVVGPISAGSAALPDNVTTINNAQVIATFATANFTGTLVTDESASLTVTVTPPQPPATGIKQLYFEELGTEPDNLTRDINVANGRSSNLNNGGTLTLNQGIAFSAPFTINGATDVVVKLRIRKRSNPTTQVQVELFNGNTGTAIGTPNSSEITAATDVWMTLSIPITIPADVNFAVNDYVQLVITNSSGGNNRRLQIRTRENIGGGVIERSQLQIESSTVINVDNIAVFATAYPATTQFSSYAPGSTIFIRTTISDPFGNADITNADITITDSATTVQVNNDSMTSVATPTGATRVYEYQYTIPATPDGYWDISITATEGMETLPVTHTAQSTLIVGNPTITISKNNAVLSDPVNASNPKAIPGAIVEYTVDVINAGFGYVDTDTLIVSDPVPTGSTFFFGSPISPITFVDGVVFSGLTFTFTSLSSTTDDVDFSNDGGGTFITPTTDASGFDTTSPPINFIRINPKGGLRGSDGVNDPSMQINFRVRVD